eukprot:TRINITY_DN1387_c0_g1_i1.p2 TRINITY_DN1387_c0_g1~~TRINITY_DN1387_c0_g1_i1.p2  ORF type:complete len:65 (+),score=15.07 TRINITY_DN1387_c0_g1_i1:488-682(+)
MDINVTSISYQSSIFCSHSPIAIFFVAHKNYKTPWYANKWDISNVKTKSEKLGRSSETAKAHRG